MKVGEFDVELQSARVGGGWQAVGILPDGKKITSGPCSSREAAEHDIKQQALARLYTQRRYDVNRPFESQDMKNRKHPDLSPSEEAIVMHQADQLLEDARDFLELSLDGSQIERPECPRCGGGESEPVGDGRHKCPNCNGVFSANVNQYPAGPLPPGKASFYPSDGGGTGGGSGMANA